MPKSSGGYQSTPEGEGQLRPGDFNPFGLPGLLTIASEKEGVYNFLEEQKIRNFTLKSSGLTD